MSRSARLTVVLGLNAVLVGALLVVGLSAHSLGVLAEGVDFLADAAGIGVSLFAIGLSKRPSSQRRPDGYPNATAIAALVNGGWLLIACVLVAVVSIERLATTTPKVHGLPVLVMSAVAAAVMLVGAFVLSLDTSGAESGDEGGNLNMRAVVLDTAGDAAAAAGVAVAGVVILATRGWFWVDPATALTISLVVGVRAAQLLKRVARVLRTGEPVV